MIKYFFIAVIFAAFSALAAGAPQNQAKVKANGASHSTWLPDGSVSLPPGSTVTHQQPKK